MASQTEIDRWLASLDERQVLADLDQMERRAEELDRQIQSDIIELKGLRERIARSRSALELKTALATQKSTTWAAVLTSLMKSPARRAADNNSASAPARGREAVRALMRELPDVEEWTIPTVLAALVERGWANADDEHAVGVSLSRMARAGELERLRKGVYRLPAKEENLELTLEPRPQKESDLL